MFKLVPLENGLENVQGFFCGATNVGMRKRSVPQRGNVWLVIM